MDQLVSFLTPWGVAILVAVVVMAVETWLTRPDPMGFLQSLRQPPWALPFWVMASVPLFFYGACVVAAEAMLRAGEPGRLAFWMVAGVLFGNTLFNYLMIGRRRFDWTFRYAVLFAIFVGGAAGVVFTVDPVAGALMGAVLAFVVYDVLWIRALAALHPEYTGAGAGRAG